jgi:hypothetical protein
MHGVKKYFLAQRLKDGFRSKNVFSVKDETGKSGYTKLSVLICSFLPLGCGIGYAGIGAVRAFFPNFLNLAM